MLHQKRSHMSEPPELPLTLFNGTRSTGPTRIETLAQLRTIVICSETKILRRKENRTKQLSSPRPSNRIRHSRKRLSGPLSLLRFKFSSPT